MERPSRDTLFLDIAALVATRGTCPRRTVGAVIVRDGRIVSMGYNGAPPGMPHCDEVGCGGGEREMVLPSPRARTFDDSLNQGHIGLVTSSETFPNGCTRATHAETNAIVFSARHGVPTDGATMYSTCATCTTCAALVVASGIARFVYAEEHRLNDGITLLKDANVEVHRWTPSETHSSSKR